ncbi:MAG: hypothetical protein AVDCRST_MAG73-1898 [uncultured Thermomicrobiales bacterium]|uniref:Luciferase domain-containing protein n=1 Tax=uncultured Thermomicrobiales bacterium TaxID=1645740 RepID=A0A6J4U6W6_9BACT|nr:MAG: hypothetical protein AVDCRST_MAG73-1898 [uncultured Thermomicrobiales bacterium]
MDAHKRIRDEVRGWPQVEEAPHRFGGIEFRLGRRELGHLHGDRLADLPFPVRIRKELVRDGRAHPHHLLPDSGWVSYWIRSEDDIPGAISLFRLSYDRAVAVAEERRRRAGGAAVSAATLDQIDGLDATFRP